MYRLFKFGDRSRSWLDGEAQPRFSRAELRAARACVEEPSPEKLHSFFTSARGIGPFRAMFYCYYASIICDSLQVQEAARLAIRDNFVAEWGTGLALNRRAGEEICPQSQHQAKKCGQVDKAPSY